MQKNTLGAEDGEMERTTYTLPYFLKRSKNSAVVCRIVGNDVQTIEKWKHGEIGVTVEYESNNIVGLIDYREGLVYHRKGEKFVAFLRFSPNRTWRDGICFPGNKIRVWFAKSGDGSGGYHSDSHYVIMPTWEIAARPIVVARGGVIATNVLRTAGLSEKPVAVAGYITANGALKVVKEPSCVCAYAASKPQWSMTKTRHNTVAVGVYTEGAELFNAVFSFSPDRCPVPTGFLAASDGGVAVVIFPVQINKGNEYSALLVWRNRTWYPQWAGVIWGRGDSVFADGNFLYVSVRRAVREEIGEVCHVWKIDGEVEYFASVGDTLSEELDLIKQCNEYSAQIRGGKKLFPIAEEGAPLWISALVSPDRNYVRLCAETSWIPLLEEVEFLSPDGWLRVPKMVTISIYPDFSSDC